MGLGVLRNQAVIDHSLVILEQRQEPTFLKGVEGKVREEGGVYQIKDSRVLQSWGPRRRGEGKVYFLQAIALFYSLSLPFCSAFRVCPV